MTLVPIPKTRRMTGEKKIDTQPIFDYDRTAYSSSSMSSAVDLFLGHEYPDWHDKAKCRDYPQEWFFGEEDDESKIRLSMAEVRRAQAICNTCPVQMECLEFALRHQEEFGVWGGSTGRQRARWLKSQEQDTA